MTSRLPFAFLPLLAAVVCTLFFDLTWVVAAPTCGLVPHQVVASVGSAAPKAGNGSLEDVVATGWYAGWSGDQFPPNQISWDKYTALTFAFA